MATLLLSAHVLAAIVLIGPITVASSVFPRYATAAADRGAMNIGAVGAAAAMHRITRAYTPVAIAVPVLGIATALLLRVLAEPWVLVSIAVTVVGGVLLVRQVVPLQRSVLEVAASGAAAGRDQLQRLRMWTGLFSLSWAAVVVLMILRPGSTTHV